MNSTYEAQVDGSQKTQMVDSAGNAVGGTSAAPADATTNAAATSGFTQALLRVFNGTTWDRLRGGVTAIVSTFTGFLNAIPYAKYDATPPTRTDGQGGPLQAEADGSLRTSLATGIAGEDLTNDVLKVEQRYSFTNIAGAATTTVKGSAGFFAGIVINKWVSGAVITIYDNTAASGTKIATITQSAAQSSEPPWPAMYFCTFTTGLTIVTSAASDLTVLWR